MTDAILQSWDILETLPGTEFFRLYQHPSSALAIFRKRLTELAKSFVMAMLYMRAPLPVSDLELWVKQGSTGDRDNAIDLLRRYHIFSTATTAGGVRAYSLTENFSNSLRQALTGAGEHESFGVVATSTEAEGIATSDLDNFARNQWEGILGFMVGNSGVPLETTAVQPSKAVKELLKAGHLIDAGPGGVQITKEGFAFVLQDVNTQVWALLFLYVENAELLQMSKVEVLSFLFLVSSLELGLAYSKENLTQTQLSILSDLCDFGIVYQRAPSSTAPHFYPTRLAVTLTSDSTSALASVSATLSSSLRSSSSNTGGKGFIIIETNFRVYAYTESPLQIALLGLFVNLRSRHPNLVTGKMTKRSVQRAVQNGITAEQIISYLSSHAHPQMRRSAAAASANSTDPNTASNNPNLRSHALLPGTIIDQINLWQLERDRMTATAGYLFSQFETQSAFDGPCKYADEIGVLVWKDEKKRMFFVNRIEGIKGYMSSNKGRDDGG